MNDHAPFVSYAQHGEDVILWRALGDRDGGFYVDVGAFDPTNDSVTRALYERGWRGINFEPQPDRLEAFERERPEDTNLSLAIGDSDGTAALILPENPGWASLLDPALTGSDTRTIRRLQVPIRRLDTLLPELDVKQVDILKIDVEGAEPAVVRGFIEGPIRPLVCVVEGVAPGVGRAAGDEAVALLVDAGYLHCLFDGLNHYLTTDPALQPALSIPANPIDGYQTDLVNRLLSERHDLHATIAALATENLGLRAVPAPIRAAEPEHVPADSSQTSPEDFEPAVGNGPTATSSDLPLPASNLADPRSQPRWLKPTEKSGSDFLDPAVRASRRRITFARLLIGDPPALPPPISALASFLRLAVEEHAPVEAVSVLFQAILGREADPGGLAAWSERLEQGQPLLGLARELATSTEALAASPEHRARVRSDLMIWESFVAVSELGVASWHPDRPYTPGAVAHEIFVGALFEVALQRRPTPNETRDEVAKLVGGAGREWLLRSYATRPESRTRLLGKPSPGIRGRLSRWRNGRDYLDTFRALVAAAEAQQVAQILTHLTTPGSAFLDVAAPPTKPGEVR